MLSFADFADEKPLSGDKMRIKDILGKEIILKAYRITASKYPDDNTDCLMLQYDLDGEEHITFTSSKVLANQIQKYQEHLPFKTTLVKVDRYITMS